jgi:hypothetical protein
LKRLALLWLACAAVGFAAAASAALVIALAVDRPTAPHERAAAAHPAHQGPANNAANARTPGYNGQRLIDN